MGVLSSAHSMPPTTPVHASITTVRMAARFLPPARSARMSVTARMTTAEITCDTRTKPTRGQLSMRKLSQTT